MPALETLLVSAPWCCLGAQSAAECQGWLQAAQLLGNGHMMEMEAFQGIKVDRRWFKKKAGLAKRIENSSFNYR